MRLIQRGVSSFTDTPPPGSNAEPLVTPFLDFFGLIYSYDERGSDVPEKYDKVRLTDKDVQSTIYGITSSLLMNFRVLCV
jgi:hypothetical protein